MAVYAVGNRSRRNVLQWIASSRIGAVMATRTSTVVNKIGSIVRWNRRIPILSVMTNTALLCRRNMIERLVRKMTTATSSDNFLMINFWHRRKRIGVLVARFASIR